VIKGMAELQKAKRQERARHHGQHGALLYVVQAVSGRLFCRVVWLNGKE
jgi:hypothetical protein